MYGLSNTAYGGGLLKDTPLIAKIFEYIDGRRVGFHTPGHRQGRGMSPALKKLLGSSFLKGDLTEVPGLDNLRYPRECLRESQGLAAAIFGARRTFFLVNGSTVGIQAAILGLNRQGGKVLVPRNAHVSVVNGLILSGGQPVLVPAAVEPRWGIALGLEPSAVEEAVDRTRGLELAVFTNPNYQGIGLEPKIIKQAIGRSPIPLICDEAHGAHLFFLNEPALSAQRDQFDVVVQSTHKTLGALTQAAMLHINSQRLISPVREALETLQTTSPSYLLLASLDAAQAQMGYEGVRLAAKGRDLAETLKRKIRRLGDYRLLEDELSGLWLFDPCKIALSAAPLGLTGWELAEILADKYGIIIELSDYYYCLILITHGHSKGDIQRLLAALAEIRRDFRRKPLSRLDIPADLYSSTDQVVLSPRQVYQTPKEIVPWNSAKGRLAGRALTVYPPGIPLVWPGQEISREHLEYLEWAVNNRLTVHGLSGEGNIHVAKME